MMKMRYHKTVSMETLEQNFNAQLKQLLLNEVTMETMPPPPSLTTGILIEMLSNLLSSHSPKPNQDP